MAEEKILAPLTEADGAWVWRQSGTRRAVDDMVAELERRWGFERLPRLVSPELRARFEQARDMHRQATMAGEDLADMDAMMMRAWRALEAEALSRGESPLPGAVAVWQADEEERGSICLCLDDEHAQALLARAKAVGENIEVWTLAEVGRIVQIGGVLAEAKKAFPQAKVAKRGAIQDDIPF